jgi:group I intron endonuclease
MLVYKLTCLKNGRIYVGLSSRSLERRWREHVRDATGNPRSAIGRAIRKHGAANFKYETLEQLQLKDGLKKLAERELFWIRKLESQKRGVGYNVSMGSYTNAGYRWTKRSREKAQSRGQTTVHQYSADGTYLNTFYSVSEASRRTGIDASNIYRAIPRGSLSGGFTWIKSNDSPESRITPFTKNSPSNQKKLYCFNREGKLVGEYESGRAASRQTGICFKHISQALVGIAISVKGYAWSFKPKLSQAHITKLQSKKGGERKQKSVTLYDVAGCGVGSYASVGAAAEAAGCSTTAVSACCKGRRSVVTSKLLGICRFRYSEKAPKRLPQLGVRIKGSKRRVARYDHDGKLVELHESISAAAQALGCERSNIRHTLNAHRKTALGFRFRYHEENQPSPKTLPPLKTRMAMCQFELSDGRLILAHTNARAAAKRFGTGVATITRAANGRTYSAFGFLWRWFPVSDVPKKIKITLQTTSQGFGRSKLSHSC